MAGMLRLGKFVTIATTNIWWLGAYFVNSVTEPHNVLTRRIY